MDNRNPVSYLASEKDKLVSIIRKTEKRLKDVPEGHLRIIKHGKKYQYYFRRDAADRSGVYLPVSNNNKALAVIQKDYDRRVVRAAQEQLSVVSRFIKKYDPEVFKRLYESLSEERRRVVFPVEVSDHEYIKSWEAYEYEKKEFSMDIPEHYTSREERVRSKSEVMIADALNQAGIPYRYECPMTLGGVTVHPDFTILRIADREEIYWEHLGIMDNEEYCNNALQRIRIYERHGIFPGVNLILTMETSRIPINHAVIKQMIKIYCE